MTVGRVSAILILFLSSLAVAAERPNFLIILGDDCTYNDLPLYGGENARTPSIDKLASEGLTFNRAYLSEAMCQPCRSELYSGQYPMRNGCAWNHSSSRPTTTSMPHHLGRLGYRVGISGKVHVKPQKAYPFEKVPGFDPLCVRNPTRQHIVKGIKDFMASKEEPFCLVVALVEPHVPWVMGDASKYPPERLKLPANFADTPRTRADFSAYLAEITYMDDQIGQILKALDDVGQAGNTLVLFSSEQGAQFPGCKWTNWDTGVHTALVARWPGRVAAGKRTDALLQYSDVLPTFIDAAGGKPGEFPCDGTSFLKVLLGKTEKHRDYVYTVHNNIPEGPAYPIRSVTDGTYHYIRNLLPDELYIEKHLMGGGHLNNPYWATWLGSAWTNPHNYEMVKRYTTRPADELYNTSSDPYELKNLAGDSESKEIKARLSTELDRWLKTQGDPGAIQDTHDVYQAARKGQHKYFPPGK